MSHSTAVFAPARVLLLAAALLALAAGCGKTPPPATPGSDEPASHVSGKNIEFSHGNPQLDSLQTVVARPFDQPGENFTGLVTWDEDTTDRVYSPVAGQVEKVIAQVGQTVKKGDDLALMHSSDFGQAQADYRKALGDFAQFDKTLARIKFLREHGAAADKDVESAQADFDRGLAEKERAEANLQLLGTTSGNFNDVYHLVSPISGVVVDKSINVGQQIRADLILANTPQATAPLFTITDPSKLWVELDVPETRLGRLRVGEAVELRSPAYPGRVFTGRIDDVSEFLDPLTRVAHARASVANPDGLLKGQMYVSVEVKEAADALTDVALPARAVIYEDGQYYVFVEVAPRKFARRRVTLERESGPDGLGDAVVRGIKPGQPVVAEGSLLVDQLMADEADEGATQALPSPGPTVENGDAATPDLTPRPL
jgi:cobalt-zinc-cadmium efflux system membrane fusion protein